MRRTTPFGELTRYFLDGFFRPAFLGEHGEDALRQLFVTLASATAMLGLFLLLPLLKKYGALSGMSSAIPYREALLSDQILVLSVPMIIIGLAMTVVAPALYVDESDFVVLTPLPVSSATVFAGKLTAVTMFVAVFVLAANTVGNIWFPAISGGRWATHTGLARMGAHAVASLLATSFVAIALAMVQGLSVTLLPRRFSVPASTTVQALLICGLTTSIPLLLRMPGRLEIQPWMMFVPPCWFVGVSRRLLGDADPVFARLANIALAAYVTVFVGMIACYVVAYLQLGRSTMPIPRRSRTRTRLWPTRLIRPTRLAGLSFIRATLSRTRLNLLVLAGVSAIGLGLVVDMLLTSIVGRFSLVDFLSREVTYRAIAPELILTLTLLVGLRAAFLLPVKREANWVFRFIDTHAARVGLLSSVESWFAIAGVGVPMLIGVPLQVATLGLEQTIRATPLTVLMALVMTEVVLRRWRRVPFTCTYIPGKQHLAKVMLVAWGAYMIAVFFAGHVIAWAILRPSRLTTFVGVLLATYAVLRWRRLAASDRLQLEFEDEMPDVIRSLGLSS